MTDSEDPSARHICTDVYTRTRQQALGYVRKGMRVLQPALRAVWLDIRAWRKEADSGGRWRVRRRQSHVETALIEAEA